MAPKESPHSCCADVVSLKEELHIDLLGHLDLCIIFMCLLRQDLGVYNLNSVNTLRSLLGRRYTLSPSCSTEEHDSLNRNTCSSVHNDIRTSKWDATIKHILRRLRRKFDYLEGRDTTAECSTWELTEPDYEYCSSCLKREAVGLRCLLRRCTCKARNAPSKEPGQNFTTTLGGAGDDYNGHHHHVDDIQPPPVNTEDVSSPHPTDPHPDCASLHSIGINNSSSVETSRPSDKGYRRQKSWSHVLSENHTYEVTACKTCSDDLDSARVVAVISPFIYKGDKTPSKGAVRSMKRSIREMSGGAGGGADELDWVKNVEIYTKDTFPLDSFLANGVNDSYTARNKDETNASVTIANLIVDLVETLMSPEDATSQLKLEPTEFVVVILKMISLAERKCPYFPIRCKQQGPDVASRTSLVSTTPHTSGDVTHVSLDGTVDTTVEAFLVESHGELIRKVNQLVPFPTMYWLTDPGLVSRVSTLEGGGEITRMQNIINDVISAWQHEGLTDARGFVEKLIKDNLAYILRRFEVVHPKMIALLYTILVNSVCFERFYSGNFVGNKNFYISLSDHPHAEGSPEDRRKVNPELAKATAIMNTIRAYGIGGNKSFVHIKCLHTNLAFAIAEGSTVGNMVFNTLTR